MHANLFLSSYLVCFYRIGTIFLCLDDRTCV